MKRTKTEKEYVYRGQKISRVILPNGEYNYRSKSCVSSPTLRDAKNWIGINEIRVEGCK